MPTARYASLDVLDQSWKLGLDLIKQHYTQPLAQMRNTKTWSVEGPEITLSQELCFHGISILVLVAGVEISDHMPAKMEFDLLIPC
jgi:hypothetical protein